MTIAAGMLSMLPAAALRVVIRRGRRRIRMVAVTRSVAQDRTGLARDLWRAPTEEPGGVLWDWLLRQHPPVRTSDVTQRRLVFRSGAGCPGPVNYSRAAPRCVAIHPRSGMPRPGADRLPALDPAPCVRRRPAECTGLPARASLARQPIFTTVPPPAVMYAPQPARAQHDAVPI